MTIRDRVVTVAEAWCGFGGFDTATQLIVLWGKSAGNAIPFTPQAVSRLIEKLQKEFAPEKPDPKDLSKWNATTFSPPGTVDTVEDLVSAVMFAPGSGKKTAGR